MVLPIGLTHVEVHVLHPAGKQDLGPGDRTPLAVVGDNDVIGSGEQDDRPFLACAQGDAYVYAGMFLANDGKGGRQGLGAAGKVLKDDDALIRVGVGVGVIGRGGIPRVSGVTPPPGVVVAPPSRRTLRSGAKPMGFKQDAMAIIKRANGHARKRSCLFVFALPICVTSSPL
jgi:hypothetical protein